MNVVILCVCRSKLAQKSTITLSKISYTKLDTFPFSNDDATKIEFNTKLKALLRFHGAFPFD